MILRHLEKSFDGTPVLDDLSLDLPDEGISAVLGPSGCGKTTLLRICSGLLVPDSVPDEGLSEIRGRRASFLFQEPRLLPWESAFQNVELVLSGLPESERKTRVSRFLELVGLAGFESYRPEALSGGMRQRVALARCFAYESEMVYMDEPFQGLDLELKLSLIDAFRRLWAEDGRTVVLVTHDVLEAALLGDRIVVLTKRPSRVRAAFDNPVPRGDRSLTHQATLALQGRLYDLLLSMDRSRSEESD